MLTAAARCGEHRLNKHACHYTIAGVGVQPTAEGDCDCDVGAAADCGGRRDPLPPAKVAGPMIAALVLQPTTGGGGILSP